MEKQVWVAPTVTPLASVKDAELGLGGVSDGLVTKHASSS